MAFANKYKKDHTVTVAYFGDGAANEGTIHECMNLASVLKLPIIFLCENNKYAITTDADYATSVKDISVRAAAYNIVGETVDGNDVVAVYEAFARAKERALKGEGPTLLECKTYRWRGHWTGDPEPYRTREDVDWWKENKDPIKLFAAYLTENKLAAAEELEKIAADAADRMAKAEEFALNSPEPDPAHVLDDVFYEG